MAGGSVEEVQVTERNKKGRVWKPCNKNFVFWCPSVSLLHDKRKKC